MSKKHNEEDLVVLQYANNECYTQEVDLIKPCTLKNCEENKR